MERLVEGDYVYVGGIGYLAVKGVSHPPGGVVVAIPVYRKESQGFLRINSLDEAYRVLKRCLPESLVFDDHAGQVIPHIPQDKIERAIRAVDGLRAAQKVDTLGSIAIDLADKVASRAGLSAREEVGLSGSILLGLSGRGSDIDLLFYPKRRASSIVDALRELRETRSTDAVDASFSHDISSKRRDSCMSVESWLRHESRKLLYGVYRGFLYSAKIVPLGDVFWEPYGSRRWREVGRATVRAVVIDDSRSIYTPNEYGIKVIEVLEGEPDAIHASEIFSYRSRFAEQAKEGDEVIASGRLEVDLRSWDFRLLVGNERGDMLGVTNLL